MLSPDLAAEWEPVNTQTVHRELQLAGMSTQLTADQHFREPTQSADHQNKTASLVIKYRTTVGHK